ncbi:MAG TPA: hypothetical protein VEI03_09285 [Stellaceae bacterium]|nr:hypothetical protein [Stellaceae bacterium]
MIVAAILAPVGSALADYMTGEHYMKLKPAYQLGYAVGAIDMLTELQSSGSLQAGPLNDAVAKIARCLVDNKVTQPKVAAAYVTYLEANPKSKAEPAALGVFEALKAGCKI